MGRDVLDDTLAIDDERYNNAAGADENLPHACAALNRGVERCVEIAFAQYQWTYKRFPDDVSTES
jgi:lauroyl/myristoyl acyltransferase